MRSEGRISSGGLRSRRARLVRAAAVGVVVALLAAACSDSSSEPELDGALESLEVSMSDHSTLSALLVLDSGTPAQVDVVAVSGDHRVELPRTAATDQRHEIPVAGLRAEREYDLEVTLVGAEGSVAGTGSIPFETGELPEFIQDFELTFDADRSQAGYTIVEVNPGELEDLEEGEEDPVAVRHVIALDPEGEVVWYYRNTSTIGDVRLTDDGTFLSHYWPVGAREFDLLGDVVANWTVAPDDTDVDLTDEQRANLDAILAGNEGDPPPVDVVADWVDLRSFHHEVFPLPNGNLLTMSTTRHELTEDEREAICPGDEHDFTVLSDVMMEFERDGTVVKTWDLADVVDVNEVPGTEMCEFENPFANETERDWTHGNAAIYDPERDAIIISSRHTNQVIAMDYGDTEGPQTELRWIFGEAGTIPLEGDEPRYQHAVELQDDGSILLYDNGNSRPGTDPEDPDNPPYSRAVLYDVDDSSSDPSDWSVTQVWEHRMDDVDGSPLYAWFLGDADRLENGNVLIDHGGIDPAEGFNRVRIVEVVPEGESGGDVVWDLSIANDERDVTSYRAGRVPSLYAGPDWEL